MSEAVKAEAEGGEDSKVRAFAASSSLCSGSLARLQDTRDAQKMLGHVDRKLVKQV